MAMGLNGSIQTRIATWSCRRRVSLRPEWHAYPGKSFVDKSYEYLILSFGVHLAFAYDSRFKGGFW